MEGVDLGEGGNVHREAPIGEDYTEHDSSSKEEQVLQKFGLCW